ncbi:MAG: alpha/beta fold hydrolase [Patescibacteria group bacterium]
MKNNIFIFHGTEGYPEENWFPWMKQELEQKGHKVFVPQFPSPPIVPAKISEWFDVLKNYEQYINEDTLLVGHSLGGIFTLRVLEKLTHPVKAAFFVGTPVGVRPIANYDRDNSFSGFTFDWDKIKNKAKHFVVFQSDDDPYVGLENGKELAKNLGVELSFVPNAGHFNKKAGYVKFEKLRDMVLEILE